jgi:hypothetical protein
MIRASVTRRRTQGRSVGVGRPKSGQCVRKLRHRIAKRASVEDELHDVSIGHASPKIGHD